MKDDELESHWEILVPESGILSRKRKISKFALEWKQQTFLAQSGTEAVVRLKQKIFTLCDFEFPDTVKKPANPQKGLTF